MECEEAALCWKSPTSVIQNLCASGKSLHLWASATSPAEQDQARGFQMPSSSTVHGSTTEVASNLQILLSKLGKVCS